MLSGRIYKVLEIVSPLFFRFGIFSLTWDTTSHQFVLKLERRLVVQINFVAPLCWLCFWFAQIHHFTLLNDYNQLIFMLSCTFGYLIGIISFFIVHAQPYNVLCTLNANIIFLRRINRKFKKINAKN